MIRLVAPFLALLAACVPCGDVGVSVAQTCLPDRMASDTELSVEVEEPCGNTCQEAPACAVTVGVDGVTFVVQQTECTDCTPSAVCQHRRATCVVPALSVGEYTFNVPGQGSFQVAIEPGEPASCVLP